MPSVKELVPKMGDADQGTAYKAYRDLELMVTRAGAPGEEAEAKQLAGDLAEQLHARTPKTKDDKGKEKGGDIKYSAEVRNRILRLMSFVAQDDQVPAIAETLGDLDLREMAKFALTRTPTDTATNALIKALDEQVGPHFRAGIVGALATRKGETVLATLRKCVEDANRPVRISAVEALANFPDPANDQYMVTIFKNESCERCKARAMQSRVELAETLAKAGKKDAARRICKDLAGLKCDCGPKKAAQLMLENMG